MNRTIVDEVNTLVARGKAVEPWQHPAEQRAAAYIQDEAEAQRGLHAAEDSLLAVERRLKVWEAAADLEGAQQGTNDLQRKALAKGLLDADDTYRAVLADADALRGEVRECRIVLAVATHLRELAMWSVRLAAREER